MSDGHAEDMAEPGFEAEFPSSQEQVVWKHVEGSEPSFEELVRHHGLTWVRSGDSSRAEFDDFQHFYVLRLYSLTWVKDTAQVAATPVVVYVMGSTMLSWAPERLEPAWQVRETLTQNPDWVLSSARLLYYFLDALVGELFPFLDRINERIDRMEQRAFRAHRQQIVQAEIFRVKREVFRTRRIFASMRDAISQLVRYWSTHNGDDSFYYMELYDHMIRLFDTVDTYRELINSALDLSLSSVSNRLNEIVKTLTLVTTVLLPASLMAALYGMNFDYLPLSHYKWGFLVIIGIIGCISLGLYWMFRRRRWL